MTAAANPVAATAPDSKDALCNGVAAGSTAAASGSVNNINYTTTSRVDSVSSFDKNSTFNNHSSALVTTSNVREVPSTIQETKRTPYDSVATNDRINLFDKDKATAATAVTTGVTFSSTSTIISSDTGALKNGINPEGFSSISSRTLTSTTSAASSSYTTSSNIITSDKGDDNVKDRYNIQQGIRDQSQTGRFGTQPSSVVSNATVSSANASGSSEAKKQEFGRTKRSSSDAELIFGAKGPDFYKPRFSTTGLDFKTSNDSISDAELIFGTSAVSGPPSATATSASSTFNRHSYGNRDSSSFTNSVSDSDHTFGKKEERNVFSKSLSVSSEKSDSSSITDRFRAAPKAYEPPKIASSISSSSAGSKTWSNKYDEDDFDLK
uniref:(northern house mosquito) hypothetical protein n=1 Tax=Culex pipiens TaxID=7175 RepID=A0A8D8HRP7_CULPI